MKKKARVRCTLRAWLKIKIYPPIAKKTPADPDTKGPKGIPGVYGHEQLHVENLLAAAKNVLDKANELEKEKGCRVEDACTAPGGVAAQVQAQIQQLLTDADKKELGHKSDKPKKGVNYPPMNAPDGFMDCDKPGEPPDFPKGKPCPELKSEPPC